MDSAYKSSKEAFVSGTTGSSVSHINLVSSVAVLSIAFHTVLTLRIPKFESGPLFLLSFLTLVIPLLLVITVFAHSPATFALYVAVPTFLISLIPCRENGTPLPSSSSADAPSARRQASLAPLPALTTYRAHMLLLTSLSILAVDFPVFPRMLAKCETYGVSLMDMGVGSFVFSQGLTSAHPILRDPAYLSSPLAPKLIRTVKKCLPVLGMGIVRVLLVKGTEYPEHVTEYGVHWNFFLTLGILPILQLFLHPMLSRATTSITVLGLLTALSHHFGLSLGLASYILHAPRTGFVSANKEGLISLTGYLALHLLGLGTGTLVLPPSPTFFRRQQKQLKKRDSDSNLKSKSSPVQHRENDKTATELVSYASIYWALLGICSLLGLGGGVSRRMVNLPYILWVAAYNTTFLLAYLILDLIFFPSPLSKSIYDPTSGLKVHARAGAGLEGRDGHTQDLAHAPDLLEAINRNGLLFFLLANLATGAVNLSMKTMYASDQTSMSVLAIYSFGICWVAWALRYRRLF
ncbi:GWT1-domain-containing protein [Amylostereum chailletii]|nr:GWT1-domain-containing protein [Amylostereum chailletii]